MSFGVSIFRDDFVFSSGHLMFYGDTEIEASHGHNYKVGVEIRGELDRNGMLVDFRDVKKCLKDEISKLNQKFIIPENSKLVLENAGEMLKVSFRKCR